MLVHENKDDTHDRCHSNTQDAFFFSNVLPHALDILNDTVFFTIAERYEDHNVTFGSFTF